MGRWVGMGLGSRGRRIFRRLWGWSWRRRPGLLWRLRLLWMAGILPRPRLCCPGVRCSSLHDGRLQQARLCRTGRYHSDLPCASISR